MFGHMLNHNSSNTCSLSICHLFVKIWGWSFISVGVFPPFFVLLLGLYILCPNASLQRCCYRRIGISILQRRNQGEERRQTLSKAWWTCTFWNEIAGSPSSKIPSYLPLLSTLNADLPWDLSSPLPWCDTARSLISHDRGDTTVQSIIPEFHACSLAPKLLHACVLWIFSRQECPFF